MAAGLLAFSSRQFALIIKHGPLGPLHTLFPPSEQALRAAYAARGAKRLVYTYYSILRIFFVFLVLLRPSRKSDPGLHSRLFSPLPTTARALHFYLSEASF